MNENNAPRLTAAQVRAAAAMLRMDGRQLAEAVDRDSETIWKLMRGETKNETASPRLSRDLRAFFEAKGLSFVDLDGRKGVIGPAVG
jgi:hypothetical protein